MGQRSRRAVLESRRGSGPSEYGRIDHRLRRDESLAEVVFERRAEAIAKRPLDEAHRAPAARAKRPMRVGRGAAGKAGRRIERIERCAAKTRDER
jgi:hypothetical protein